MENSVKQRLIKYLKYKGIGQIKFAESVGLSRGYVNNIVNSIQPKTLDRITKYYNDLNPSWLMTGEGNMLRENNNEETSSFTDKFKREYMTFLLPQSAMGGPLTGISADSVLLGHCEKVVSPIKGVDFAITVYGESMSPRYPSGSRLLIKKIDPNAFIDWGKAYVIDSCNGVIVKEVIKSSKEGYIICKSVNPDPKFSPFEVSLADIYGMYRILMCLSAE